MARIPALAVLLQNPMFRQLMDMYDEFRIQSFRVKITPAVTLSADKNLMLHSAFDRNGVFKMHRGKVEAGGQMLSFSEAPDEINSYSSLVSKQILQFQSGSLHRNLAASGPTEKMFFPTLYSSYLLHAKDHAADNPMGIDILSGYQYGVAPHGF